MKCITLRLLLIFVIMAGSLAVTACSGGNGEGMYETAQFEELQKNTEHALKIYNEIVEMYPESEYALKAKERIEELSGE